MSFAARITRTPRAYDSGLGAEAVAHLSDFPKEIRDVIRGAAGSSPYLGGLIARETPWLCPALDDPEDALADLFDDVTNCAPDTLGSKLRTAKRRVALMTALADLAGVWDLETVTGTLTRFAYLATDLALKAEIANQIRRGKLPGQTQDDIAAGAGLVVLAMGKMGAGELNYSSDIDLICLFDETRFDPNDYLVARAGFVRATRAMSILLNDKTADGYVFRTDLRLRPDPAVTPVCIAMEAAERYYESFGRTWERAAYIKARVAAGDLQAGDRFLKTLTPFVWRRHLDYAAIQDAHDIRLRIRETKGIGGPLTIPGHDMKLGLGGIREIEFFTQTRQLIAGGRDPDLRRRGTVAALGALASKGWVKEETATALIHHYRLHREVEHRTQMVHDAQTHKIPASSEGLARVACLMDKTPEALMADLTERLASVNALTDGFFSPGPDKRPTPPVDATGLDSAIVERWPTYPALRTQRAREIFDRLRPDLMERLASAARPEDALMAFDGFLSGLPAGVQLFSMFEANSSLIDLLIDIEGTSAELGKYLARNSGVFDAVIAGFFFSDWPGAETLTETLAEILSNETDYENQLDAARRWAKEWHFRIGVHHLRGLIDAATAGQQYADLASACLAAIAPVVVDEFARKHGRPPGRGATIVGMGSLGAERLNAQSDLDLIVVYDDNGTEMSDGCRPLPVRIYYARLTQAFITAVSAPTAQGRLYEVDMRLRPSGKQGPVATSWPAFQDYQVNKAWLWEHLVLTRARVVAGDMSLGADIETFRQKVTALPRYRRDICAGLADMRVRIAAAKTPEGPLNAKTGPGRMLDIELVAQAGALMAGSAARDIPSGIQAGVACGWLDAADAQDLTRIYQLYWSVQAAARLMAVSRSDAEALGQGGVAFLCRSTGIATLGALETTLKDSYETARSIIDRAVIPEAEDRG